MEAESFFLKSNVYFKELKEIRSIHEDAAKEVCTYPFSWQELRSGRLFDTESWKEQFKEAGAQSFQGILILLPLKDSASLCIPAWIDRNGAFIHGGDYRTLPWIRGQEEDGGFYGRAEAFLETHLQDFLDTREWRQFFKLCVQLFESLNLGGEWKEHIVCRKLSDHQDGVQEQFYDTILHENNSNRLYRNLFYRIESLGKRSAMEYESELRGQLQICEQGQEEELLLGEYIQSVKKMKRAPLIAVTGRNESWVRGKILPFWEEVTSKDQYSHSDSGFLMMPEEEDEKEWYRLLEKAESKGNEFKEKMDLLLNEVQGSIQEAKADLKRRVQETEERLQKMEKSLRKRNGEIDRAVSRKNEWIIFLDSVSGGRYKLRIWQKRLAKKVEGFCEEQDLPVLGSNRDVQEIVEVYDTYIKKMLQGLRKRNDIYNEQKEKNSQNKKRIDILETSLPAMSKMVEISMGKAERDTVDWEALETASPWQLEQILKDVCRKFQLKTAWTAFRYCKCSQNDGENTAYSPDNSEIILCDFQEFSRRFYGGTQGIDSLDLLIILDADNIPVEDGILLGNFARRMILLKGAKRWKGGVADGIRRLLMQKLELGEKQQEVYCRIETLWDMANELLTG